MPYQIADLLPATAQNVITRHPRTITLFCMVGLLEVFVHTVIR